MTYKGWHSRNYLPHFDSQDVVQFVTFRLADSLPAAALDRLKSSDKPETVRHELLDRGWGEYWLRSKPIAQLVEDAFLEFDGTRYRLHAWTVIPNHAHVLFTVFSDNPLGSIVGSWKRFTARKANEFLGRSGAFGKRNIGIDLYATTPTTASLRSTSTRIQSRQDRRRASALASW
jgi:hypothetical protein